MSATKLYCPDCGEEVWDLPYGHKLAKCWGCGIAFDTMTDDGEDEPTWTLLGTWGVFEYWLAPDSVNVSRRKTSSYNYLSAEGSPVGARWDSTLVHFHTHVAGRLAV